MKKESYKNWSKQDLVRELRKFKSRKKYGLVWEDKPEKVAELCKEKLPILEEKLKKEIKTKGDELVNILIEGDNYHALSVLNYTHKNKVDVIYIDPPYNTGKKDFRYNDHWVDKEDRYRHSKWLSFMSKRLVIAKNLLRQKGVILVHIDEHEHSNLNILINEIYGENNFLGTIIWDKKNPKGDAQGVSYQHESILVYAKNKDYFVKSKKLIRPKINAELILKKAKELFARIGKIDYPADLKSIVKKYRLNEKIIERYKKNLDLIQINKEFRNWINIQPFTAGEKAYSKIDDNGRVYRLVSMAWPNKKKAPTHYFKPLIHHITKKECPVPSRGWRYPPSTMGELLKKGLIEFGKDEKSQPQRIYYLEENMFENVPSILGYGGSDDKLLKDLGISFENPKPVKFSVDLLSYFLANGGIMLDCFAGSGSAAHALLELNQRDGGNRIFIICTNDEGKICSDVCYPRMKKIIKGYKTLSDKSIRGYGSNLKYFKTDFVDAKSTDQNKRKLVDKSTEMLCLKEGCFDEVKKGKGFKIFENSKDKYLGIIYDDVGIEPFKKEVKKLEKQFSVYVFSLDESAREEEFEDIFKFVELKPIPAVILNVYKRIFK